MRLPDFLVIGAAKSGTTTIYKYLSRHPQVFMCTPKEPTFFAYEDRYQRGVEWYASLFGGAVPGQVCGEASTNYTNSTLYPVVAERMKEVLPNAKLIYIMRHPVDRAYSYYKQLIKNERVKNPEYKVQDTFEERIEKDPSIIDSSDYMMQIDKYLQYYSIDSFRFFLMEDLIEDPENTLKRILEFIGTSSDTDLVSEEPLVANQDRTSAEWLIRSRITAPIRSIPGMSYVADSIPQGIRDKIYYLMKQLPHRRRIEKEFLPPPMRRETRKMLLNRFRKPNERLGKFLGRDLSMWND